MAAVDQSNLLKTTAAIPGVKGTCIVVFRTEWNDAIVSALESGCRQTLEQSGIDYRVVTVPGAFEIPFGIRAYWDAHKYKDDRPKAFIALGCVLRGDTPHFEYVCRAVTDGVLQLNMTLRYPRSLACLPWIPTNRLPNESAANTAIKDRRPPSRPSKCSQCKRHSSQ
jgi:6,7-dimethyl-8-ribityllumazine synthase